MNFLSGLNIVAAGEGSWIVPVLFVAVWVIGGIGKFIATARQERKKREQQLSAGGQPEKKMRYKPIPDASSQQRRERATPQAAPAQLARETMPSRQEPKRPSTIASLKKAMRDAMEDTYKQQAKVNAPKPVAARPKATRSPKRTQQPQPKPKPRPVSKEPVKKVQPQQQRESIKSGLLEKENIRKAIIYSEILGKPLALRES